MFALVILTFMVALHNLYWYYGERSDIEHKLPNRTDVLDVKAEKYFGGYVGL